MASSTSREAWEHNTDELIGKLVQTLDSNEKYRENLPGLRDLLQDYLDDEFELSDIEFHRRMLRVFRDAPRDDTYQELLEEMDEEEKSRVEDFVAMGKDPDDSGKGYETKYSLGVREHLKSMMQRDAVVVSSSGPEHIHGLSSNDLRKKDSILHSFVHGLAKFFCLSHENIGEKLLRDEVFVSDLLKCTASNKQCQKNKN